MNGRLTIAEQCIDRQTKTELFQNREIELVTGRVRLHALNDQGQPLCGHDEEQLTPTDRPWDAGYLLHLPRCQSCMAQTAGTMDHPGHATGVDIRTAQDAEIENAAATALRAKSASTVGRQYPWSAPKPRSQHGCSCNTRPPTRIS